MPLIATRGASSVQGFGQFAQSGPVNYIEDVFSTYLWTGNDSSQTITNGIDLSTKGGLVWIKSRAAYGHILSDTNRGTGKFLSSNTTDAEGTDAQDVTAFNTTGFTVGNNSRINNSSFTYASWTFRKQPKFFDVVTWTGNGTTQSIAHNLGSTPGFVMVKGTSLVSDWRCFHRSTPTGYFYLNAADALETTSAANNFGNNSTVVAPTSTTLTVGSAGALNGSGQTYVAYIFAHDAGGFGLTGTDNVISCGSFTTDGSGNATVTLGYEPQWVLTKLSSASAHWAVNDVMRGMPASQTSQVLYPSLSAAESSSIYYTTQPNATGFTTQAYANQPNNTVIYIAIRRGPMKVPTSGTSVFNTIVRAGTGANTTVTGAGFPPDFMISHSTNVGSNNVGANDKLRGPLQFMATNTTGAESTVANALVSLDQDGFSVGTLNGGPYNISGQTNAAWMFRRAPSFFDEVCYTGTGVARTITHNLAAVPELMIIKSRSRSAEGWTTYAAPVFVPGAGYTVGGLNDSVDFQLNNALFNNVRPTASVFSVGVDTTVNFSSSTYVAYLFATCAGVSKVGSYTGTGTTKQIDCGFTAGARFVLIKRTDASGDWYVWDTARGIISGNDPYLLINSSAAEVTNTDYIDTYNAGFELSSTAPAAINANGGTYIFLAIA